MRVGVVFPQTEIGGDVGAVRAYATRVEELGFSHVLAYDHVVGADPEVHQGWSGPYDLNTTFDEPFVLFGYLAAITTSLELVTGVIILPQRQAVLVAKQAAEVDLLSGGRLRVGVGLGWNAVEYEALGTDFGNRGARMEEQIEVLRALWTQRSVTFDGRFHRITGAGIAPLPVQRPIPVWIGAQSPPAYRRVGRLADGWFPQMGPGPDFDAAFEQVRQAATDAGRDPNGIGIDGRVLWQGNGEAIIDGIGAWAGAGATHVSINTMGRGFRTVDEHLAALEVAAQAAEDAAT
jgi:probable F420-dependent oxidoreductase